MSDGRHLILDMYGCSKAVLSIVTGKLLIFLIG